MGTNVALTSRARSIKGCPMGKLLNRKPTNKSSSLSNQRLSRACIVHLVIKRTNCSYVKTMPCSSSHLGIPINIKNTKFVKDLLMIDTQFRFNQCNSFREENISVFSHMVLCSSILYRNKKPKFCRGPSNEHSCVWIQSYL